MKQEILVEGLMQAASKRKMVSSSQAERIKSLILERELRTIDDVREWLKHGADLGVNLSAALKGLLPNERQRRFGAYETIAHLADGGMGSVWLVCSPTEKLAVIKTMRKSVTADNEEFRQRFERESRIMLSLQHENIVSCIDAATSEDGTHFMVLDFIDAGDLKELIEEHGKLNEPLSLSIFHQAVTGLCEAHRLKLIHRDIKPANIFVCKDGGIKLADFGVARSTEETRTMLTMQGALIGSPLYMAPEQVMGETSIDIRADIYSMGIMLYYMLVGSAPFLSKNIQEIMHMQCTASVPDLRTICDSVHDETQELFEKCLGKKPEDRFENPLLLLDAIEDALRVVGIQVPERKATQTGETTTASALNTATAGLLEASRAHIPDATIAANLNLLNDATLQATMAVDLSGNAMAETMVTDLSVGEPPQPSSDVLPDNNSNAPHAFPDTGYFGGDQAEDNIDTLVGAPPGLSSPNNEATLFGGAPKEFVETLLSSVKSETDITLAMSGVGTQHCSGDISEAMTADWLTFAPHDANDKTMIQIFAKPCINIGKLREEPVDVCLRNYPVAIHKQACMRISRNHMRLYYDDSLKALVAMDHKSANGTLMDGIVMQAMNPQHCIPNQEYKLTLADVITLNIRSLQRTSMPTYTIEGIGDSERGTACGLDNDIPLDCAILSRPENRPELTYIMLFRRISIGGSHSDFHVPGCPDSTSTEISRFNGQWIWRDPNITNQNWLPLTEGTELTFGNHILTARPGVYPDFH